MIVGFRHKGLELLFIDANPKGVPAEHKERLRNILLMLHSAESIQDLAGSPGLGLHPLKGSLAGHWAIKVNRTWRVTFRFDETRQQVSDVDYIDYH